MDNGGTFGQFIPGVTPDEGIGLGSRALQVLQLEQSDRFRSNLGIAKLNFISYDAVRANEALVTDPGAGAHNCGGMNGGCGSDCRHNAMAAWRLPIANLKTCQ